jgi:hypothetical protein
VLLLGASNRYAQPICILLHILRTRIDPRSEAISSENTRSTGGPAPLHMFEIAEKKRVCDRCHGPNAQIPICDPSAPSVVDRFVRGYRLCGCLGVWVYVWVGALTGDYPDAGPMPPLPPKGDLDLRVVLDSPYFFS